VGSTDPVNSKRVDISPNSTVCAATNGFGLAGFAGALLPSDAPIFEILHTADTTMTATVIYTNERFKRRLLTVFLIIGELP
jgi:hypothetical protein